MQLEVNSSNEILSYLTSGGIEGVDLVQFNGLVPDNFYSNFKPKYYLLNSDQIAVNPNYNDEPVAEPVPALTQQDVINAHFYKTTLDLQLKLKELESNG
ncbi:hypothetical protein NFHkm12_15360 [Latilactobacillus curvatus]|uniref:DUF2977 domain-containing protein n=1 Tax=Latilactobacillus curvatus TaxID=28038 RepID=UPI000DBB2B81|nr:DUF2977 domain-containing protein [Latilactobacillus curvatus]WBY48546.1 DUF2977 domain-containing protein [Latilactobacillus curvatus]BBE26710.1 hypothetical protein NFHkm12_15360 [Latilactobacillus curvatus]